MKYLNDAGGRFKLPLKSDTGKTLCTLLWGDPLQEIEREGSGAASASRCARGGAPAGCRPARCRTPGCWRSTSSTSARATAC